MAHPTDWKSSLTASQRYDNIQALQKHFTAAGSDKSAFAVENAAYTSCATREEYNAAVAVSAAPEDPPTSASPPYVPEPTQASAGITIGPYKDCHYVASGVTAEVYRCDTRALKVIVETHNIEPHSPAREAKILELLARPCIPLLETFRDQEQRFVLVFPYMPLTLGTLLENGSLSKAQTRVIFSQLFQALVQLHKQGIIHRDVKPSALLLESPNGPAYLSDFGTAWHPSLSAASEPPDNKILDIGTGPYRAPEVLFGNKSYGPAVDMWGAGTMLAECCHQPPKPLFESRAVHEDGNQLGLILSIFKTIGSPTRETWPEAAGFRTPPFEMYRSFPQRSWDEVLPDLEPQWRDLIGQLVKFNSSRASAAEALEALGRISDAK
ncbi:kinase-like protein [Thozetella sp. PMI_491]|nr:kinase-like protein [Thozetella sp. PMI_491]